MKKRKTYTRWMVKYGDYLLSIAHTQDELDRVQCAIRCANKTRQKGDPKETLVQVRITEVVK